MEDIIKGINIESCDEAEDILKSIECDLLFDELLKAHNVGDLFFQNGKTYVWTEYAPGKFDWHVVNKKSRIIQGKGINGAHGYKALEKAFTEVDDQYSDKTKMLLKRTPNGNWRLFYDKQLAFVLW